MDCEKKIYVKLDKDLSKKSEKLIKKIGTLKINGKEIQINFRPNKISMKNIIKIIYEANLDIIDLSTKDVSLEDVFINITSGYIYFFFLFLKPLMIANQVAQKR